MAELSTLARPYAKAAFDYAHENSVIGEWVDFLLIASNVVRDSAFVHMLDNPAINAEQKAEMLVNIYDEQVTSNEPTALKSLLFTAQGHKREGQPSDSLPAATTQIKNFVHQLAEQERLSLIPQVYEQFLILRAEALKEVNAYVTSAYPLSETQRVMIQQRLEQSLKASVIIHEEVDPSLLAGATIKIGDKLVDDSVRGKLKQLKTQLTA
ncbi:F0F1 ATP synthase subunit delta [Psychrobacter sp. FDAARGOS_221]|uniref:F0F1 ATP synthase subunit delta n=1 Tax=Psychrobacter sp. FDAARGOS_221 TaxID=1975705 RepID=UPI000BB5767A|nr:F0F1 ATP synthase subunit delta [Psychrobacter sp. FDAARGOS_221]PNK60546.1 F0F1 ATP synthase subunit delta [Psychrobacter sp. FDAARGOS_221]